MNACQQAQNEQHSRKNHIRLLLHWFYQSIAKEKRVKTDFGPENFSGPKKRYCIL